MTAVVGHLRQVKVNTCINPSPQVPADPSAFPALVEPKSSFRGRLAPVESVRELELIGDIGDAWIGPFRASYGPTLRFGSCEPSGSRDDKMLLWLDAEVAVEQIRSVIEEIHRRTTWRVTDYAKFSIGRSSLRLEGPMPPLCAARHATKARCLDCPLVTPRTTDGRVPWRVLAYGGEDLHHLRQGFASACASALKLTYFGVPRGKGSPTARQDIVLETAFRMGRFDIPARVSVSEVARELRISKTAAEVTARRGLRRMLFARYPGVR